jgi:hypothetical protein
MENMQMPNRQNQSTALFFDSYLPEDGHCRLKCIAGVLCIYKLLFFCCAVVGINIAN